jgi:hypothetical protein
MILSEQKQADEKEVVGARKPWKEINRKVEAKTVLGRDNLVLALQEKGFTYRMARELVKVILEECLVELRKTYKLETPFGVLRIEKKNPKPKQRKHRAFGYLVTTYKKFLRVRFQPAADLTIRAVDDDDAGGEAEEEKEEEKDKEMARKKQEQEAETVTCPRCKSTWMMEAEFRQYVEAYGSTSRD